MTDFCCLGQLVHCWIPQHNLKLCDDYSRLVWIHFVLQKGPWVEVNINWRTFKSPSDSIFMYFPHNSNFVSPMIWSLSLSSPPSPRANLSCNPPRNKKIEIFWIHKYLLWIWKVLSSLAWYENIIWSYTMYREMRLAALCCIPLQWQTHHLFKFSLNFCRFVVLHLLFLIVGLGSTVFHMTLK